MTMTQQDTLQQIQCFTSIQKTYIVTMLEKNWRRVSSICFTFVQQRN